MKTFTAIIGDSDCDKLAQGIDNIKEEIGEIVEIQYAMAADGDTVFYYSAMIVYEREKRHTDEYIMSIAFPDDVAENDGHAVTGAESKGNVSL